MAKSSIVIPPEKVQQLFSAQIDKVLEEEISIAKQQIKSTISDALYVVIGNRLGMTRRYGEWQMTGSDSSVLSDEIHAIAKNAIEHIVPSITQPLKDSINEKTMLASMTRRYKDVYTDHFNEIVTEMAREHAAKDVQKFIDEKIKDSKK